MTLQRVAHPAKAELLRVKMLKMILNNYGQFFFLKRLLQLYQRKFHQYVELLNVAFAGRNLDCLEV